VVKEVNLAGGFRIGRRRRPMVKCYGKVVCAAFIVSLSAIAAQGEQPDRHSVHEYQPVYPVQRLELQGNATQNLRPPRIIEVSTAHRIAQTLHKHQPVYPVQRLELQGNATHDLGPLRIIEVSAADRIAQTLQPPGLNTPESIPSPPAARERPKRDDGIKPMRALGVDIGIPAALTPPEVSIPLSRNQPVPPRNPQPDVSWFSGAPYGPSLNFCYRPLYFEESNLERYGWSAGVMQPLVSAAHFYGNVALLPCRLAKGHARICTYHDHQSRPGAPAPRERSWLRLRCACTSD